MNSKNFILDFTIPQGPTGPVGPSNGLNAYGGKYSDCLNALNVSIDNPVVVPLTGTMLASHINYTTNGITIEQAGTYEINYVIDTKTVQKANITLDIWENGNPIVATQKTKSLEANEKAIFSVNTICTLPKGGVIEITVSSDSPTEVVIEENSSLIIKQIN